MATLLTQAVTQGGVQPSYQAASAGGDEYTPASTTALFFKNGSGSPITVTIVTTATAFGQPIGNVAIPVPAGAEVIAGPYDPGMVQQSNGLANITYSAVTNLTVAAISVPPT